MIVNAITCPRCGDTIYSRTRHDYRSCSCNEVAIDGGFDYVKITYDPNMPEPPGTFSLEVFATRRELYLDWNTGADKYGIIPKGEKGNKDELQQNT